MFDEGGRHWQESAGRVLTGRGVHLMERQEEKKMLRKHMRRLREQISGREEKSRRIAESVLRLEEVKDAKSVFCYVSFRSEVDTALLLNALWKAGKVTAVPKVDGKQMAFYEIHSRDDLDCGYCGIPEPKPGCALMQQADIIVMPGLAFDTEGHRLGYGGGFYDRFLEANPNGWKLALAFEEQIQRKIPSEKQDVRVDGIVTDRRTIWI